ncbi:hypothetical protein NEOC95_000952 [Neochlamydia sp. AcF95]|nr:hypothetical protein [Neochlamydia sp. AcF95]
MGKNYLKEKKAFCLKHRPGKTLKLLNIILIGCYST